MAQHTELDKKEKQDKTKRSALQMKCRAFKGPDGTTGVAAVAKALGVEHSAVSNWIGGRRTPDDDRKHKMADMFGMSFEEIDHMFSGGSDQILSKESTMSSAAIELLLEGIKSHLSKIEQKLEQLDPNTSPAEASCAFARRPEDLKRIIKDAIAEMQAKNRQ